jgi:hypothetical protein
MNITSLTKSIYNKKALQLVLPVFAVLMGTAAFADTAGDANLFTNSGGTIDDVNPGTAYNIRVNYGKRFPFMQDAWTHDKLDLISTGQSNGDTGDGKGKTNSGGGTSNSGNQSNIKKSRLTSSKDAKTVLAYDIMVLPYGQPGHYLPGADPTHMPQYVDQGDAYIQYAQTKMIAQDQPKTMRDLELFDNQLTTFGLPCSDTQFQCIDRENNQRLLELAFDPERFSWAATTQGQLQSASAANVLAGSSEAAFRQATARIVQADGNGGNGAGGGGGGSGGAQVGALINIANEQSGVPTAADNPSKTIPQAVWMVQQMYKFVFVPLAILFLLPGAVITQVKGQIVQGFRINAEDQSSPFEGILRSMIAVFLIPATQLIVSYSIDVGNSMAYSVKDWVDLQLIFDWSRELTYNTPINNVNNEIKPPTSSSSAPGSSGSSSSSGGGFLGSISSFLGSIPFVGGALQSGLNNLAAVLGASGQGLGSDTPEDKTIAENQSWLSSAMEMMFNMATYLFSSAVIVLGAYQLIFVCYLYLLGPLAAAFFAWPRIQSQGSQKLFTDVFSNWVNAVIVVSLWRFYWMVLLAIMTQRILYIQDSGGGSNLQWEVAVFTCLLGLMMWVPFNPWTFDPAIAFETANAAGQQMMSQGSKAMGGAAKAGGMPAAQVQAIQGQINQALQPMAQVSNAWALASNGPSGVGSSLYQGTGSVAGLSNKGEQSGSQSSQGPANVSPPPNANMNSAAPQNTSAPVNSPSPQTSNPPAITSPQSSPANLALAQQQNPGAQVSPMAETTPLSPGGPSINVNPNASTDQVQGGLQGSQLAMQTLGMGGGGGSAPPIVGGGGNGGGNSDPGPSGGNSGSSGDSQTQVASLATGSGGQNEGGGSKPSSEGPDKGNDNPPPPQYA